jgi:predicted transcriptional regulator
MPKTNSARKPVKSFRLSIEGVGQLREMAYSMGRSESDVLEIALDRMYREEVRFNRAVREGSDHKDRYQINSHEQEQHETD